MDLGAGRLIRRFGWSPRKEETKKQDGLEMGLTWQTPETIFLYNFHLQPKYSFLNLYRIVCAQCVGVQGYLYKRITQCRNLPPGSWWADMQIQLERGRAISRVSHPTIRPLYFLGNGPLGWVETYLYKTFTFWSSSIFCSYRLPATVCSLSSISRLNIPPPFLLPWIEGSISPC